tara:strand:- start:280 stop:483 length:204 start_codon:yes stop_codon:yes gene_type:complete
LKKGSKAAKAWGAKMRRLRGTKTRKKSKTRKRSTRKGQRRKTARRAYTGLKKRVSRRKKSSDSAWSF